MLTCWNLVETSGKQLQVINAVASLLDVLNTQMINAVEPVETASQRSHLTCRMRKLKILHIVSKKEQINALGTNPVFRTRNGEFEPKSGFEKVYIDCARVC